MTTKIEWMSDGEIVGKTLNAIHGCWAVSPGCAHCYAVNDTTRMRNKFPGLAENGRFTGKTTYDKSILDRKSRSSHQHEVWFVNSLSDMFYEAFEEQVVFDHFDLFKDVYWQEFRVLTKRAERLPKFNTRLEWTNNVQMGVTVDIPKYLDRIVSLGKTDAKHKFISWEPWLTPDDNPLNFLQNKFPWTYEGVTYNRLRDLLKQCGIKCSLVGGESGDINEARYCGFEDIHYILEETVAAGAHPSLKQLGTSWAIKSNTHNMQGKKYKKGGVKSVWPQEFQKYSQFWPFLDLPKYGEREKVPARG